MDKHVHGNLGNGLKWLIGMASFVVVIAGMKAAQEIVNIFAMSAFLAILLAPLAVFMSKKNVPDWLNLCLIVLLTISMGVVLAWSLTSSIASFSSELPLLKSRLNELFAQMTIHAEKFHIPFSPDHMKNQINPDTLLSMTSNMLQSFGQLLNQTTLVFLFSLLFLAEGMHVSKMAQNDKTRNLFGSAAQFMESTNQYMKVKTGMSLLTALCVALMLYVLDTPHAILWAALAFFLNFVPGVGSIIAAVPAILYALIIQDGAHAAWVALAYVVINVVIGNVLEPKLLGKGVGLSSMIVFVSLFFWGWVLGPVGMLLSIPLTMIVKMALEKQAETRWVALLLGPVSDTDSS